MGPDKNQQTVSQRDMDEQPGLQQTLQRLVIVQSILLAELDGPRPRTIDIQIMGV